MVKNVIHCGECEKFLYEDTDGFGICGKTNEECRCSDKCHLINGNHKYKKPILQGIQKKVG